MNGVLRRTRGEHEKRRGKPAAFCWNRLARTNNASLDSNNRDLSLVFFCMACRRVQWSAHSGGLQLQTNSNGAHIILAVPNRLQISLRNTRGRVSVVDSF